MAGRAIGAGALMPLWIAHPCLCAISPAMGQKRPTHCRHGNRYVSEKQFGRRKPMKRSQPKRDWGAARKKVEEEGVCRVCGTYEQVQAAHIIGRAADQPKEGNPGVLYVHPDSILPLCGELAGVKCHPAYDRHELDILEFLTPEEQVQAVKDAGSIEAARRRTSPSSYRILDERLRLESPERREKAA